MDMITEPSLVGDIDKWNDLTLFSHDKNVMTRLLHLTNINNNKKKLMSNLTICTHNIITRLRLKRLNLFKSFLIFVFLLLSANTLFSQSLGDYRSVNTGSWTTLTTWQYYNGSAWVSATSYPGQNSGTNDVSIEGGDTVTLSSSISNSFNSLTIGDGTGAGETLTIGATSSLNTLLLTIESDGLMNWTSNVTFSLPVGASIVIATGGDLDGSPCSAAKRIVIGTVIISTCNGGAGAIYDFDDLISAGGYTDSISDLSLTKTLTYGVFSSSTVVFTITVTNNGPDDATGITVNDDLPNGYSYVSHTGGTYSSGTGIWDIGSLANGSSETLEITATIIYGFFNNYTNVAEIETSDNNDLDSTPGNGVDTEDDYDEVTASIVSLGISKSVNNASPCVDEDVIFTVQVTNTLFQAEGVEVTDLLPNGYNFESYTSTSGSYNDGSGIWDVGTVNSFGGSQSLYITASVNASGSFTNNASITDSDGYDISSGNNSASESVIVNAFPTAATISSIGPICPGGDAVFTISGDAGDFVTYSGASSGTATIGAGGTVDVTIVGVISNTTLNLTNVNDGSCDLALTGVNATVIVEDTINPTASNPAPIDVQCAVDVPASDITVVTDEADN
jgi:uncharacterized repeat protein (TIGR01451 family)